MKFGFITHLMDSDAGKENAGKGFAWKTRFHTLFWSMIYLLFKSKSISETDNSLEFECHINHGPEWNIGFSIPIQTSYRHFSNVWALKTSDFKQNFLI